MTSLMRTSHPLHEIAGHPPEQQQPLQQVYELTRKFTVATGDWCSSNPVVTISNPLLYKTFYLSYVKQYSSTPQMIVEEAVVSQARKKRRRTAQCGFTTFICLLAHLLFVKPSKERTVSVQQVAVQAKPALSPSHVASIVQRLSRNSPYLLWATHCPAMKSKQVASQAIHPVLKVLTQEAIVTRFVCEQVSVQYAEHCALTIGMLYKRTNAVSPRASFCLHSIIMIKIQPSQSDQKCIENFLCVQLGQDISTAERYFKQQMSQGNQHGPSKQLTLDLVFTKTKSDSLQNIKNLNLWGNQLQDLSLIEKMPNLEVVSLSVNRISSLRDFSKCPKLQQLYLRKNNITDLSEIAYLMKLPNLKVLWLHDNPCALTEHYREIVIKHLPSLMKLDNNPVSPEDKINAQKININYQRKEDKPAHNHSVYQEEGQSRAADPRWPKKNTYNVPENKKNQEKVSRPEDKYLPKQDERAQFKQEEKIQQGKADERGQQARQEYQQLSQQDYGQKSKQEYMQQGRQQYSQGKPQQRYQLKPQQRYRQQVVGKQGQTPLSKLNVKEVQRNQNIVMAILTLLQELDQSSLEIVKREAEKLLES